MIIENKFNIGDTVYLITDNEQLPRIVTEIRIGPGSNNIYYLLSSGIDVSSHYDIEMCIEVDVTKLF